jgi:hypothetical protein
MLRLSLRCFGSWAILAFNGNQVSGKAGSSHEAAHFKSLLLRNQLNSFLTKASRLGDKDSLQHNIYEATRIAIQALQGSPVSIQPI